jgi:hypothetical protein
MRTLLVGDIGFYLSIEAKKINKNALLLDNFNYKRIIDTNGVYYTSIGDITVVEHFCEVLMAADEVIFSPPTGNWSDKEAIDKLKDKRFTMETETKEHLYQLHWIKKISIKNLVIRFPNFKNKWQVTPRISAGPQIWNIGCSITAGNGVEKHQRYGEIIGKKLNMPVSILAYEGSSLIWAADQILLADVLPGDIIIWGLTSLHRYSYALHNDRFYHVNFEFYKNYPLLKKIVPIDWSASMDNLYHSLNSISIVKNFSNKIDAKLLLLEVLPQDLIEEHIEFTKTTPIEKWVDKGDDNQHPGPRQHEIFAQIALDAINLKMENRG